MVARAETQDDALVRQAIRLHARADAGFDQQLFDDVFQDAGANAVLDVVARAGFQDDRFDAAQVQQVRQQQAGRARADDADLGAGGGHGWVARGAAGCARSPPPLEGGGWGEGSIGTLLQCDPGTTPSPPPPSASGGGVTSRIQPSARALPA